MKAIFQNYSKVRVLTQMDIKISLFTKSYAFQFLRNRLLSHGDPFCEISILSIFIGSMDFIDLMGSTGFMGVGRQR